jgi:hypothetical protein
MDLKEIMSVSGQGGLFKFITQARNGIIVESFADGKRSFVSASNKVSSLEDIAIFTDDEEVPLKRVLKSIHDLEQGKPAPDPKSSPDVLKTYMQKVLPNYDQQRVYVSDIKKLLTWYNTLLSLNLLNFEDETEEKETNSETETAMKAESVEPEKPVAEKKTATKDKPKTKKAGAS